MHANMHANHLARFEYVTSCLPSQWQSQIAKEEIVYIHRMTLWDFYQQEKSAVALDIFVCCLHFLDFYPKYKWW